LSPNGKRIAAIKAETQEAARSEDGGATWHIFSGVKTEYISWSSNSEFCYCLVYDNKKAVVIRLDSNAQSTPVLNLPDARYIERWTQMTVSGQFRVAKNNSVQEIYSLELDSALA
jgi:hypothetical protein